MIDKFKMPNLSVRSTYVDKAIEAIKKLYSPCRLCGQNCNVDRNKNEMGLCRIEADENNIKIASHTLHFGEEPMIVGTGGSGTVFFSNCNLRCVYCQNHQISHNGLGEIISIEKLAQYFLDLQNSGAININLVSATHVLYQVLHALKIAIQNGLNIPIVYNTNAYDNIDTISALHNVVDIYLPDIKYLDNAYSKKYSNAKNYFDIAMNNIKLMYEQVGAISFDENNNAKKGLIVRHLILPNNISSTYDILIALSENNLKDITLSIMSQYTPQYMASKYEELNTIISEKEYDDIIDYASELGFENILAQDFDSQSNYLPDFDKNKPFDD